MSARRRALLICAACALVLGLGAWLSGRSRELLYRGRPLSYWLELCSHQHPQKGETDEQREAITANYRNAEEALRIHRTKAPGYLVALMSREVPVWEPKLVALLSKILPLRFVPNWSERIYADINAAYVGFSLLQDAASPAIPGLQRLALAPYHERRGIHAVNALAMIGSKSLPALMSIASNPAADTRCVAICRLGDFRTNSLAALPLLLTCLQGTDTNLAVSASEALGHLALAEETVVPALDNALHNPDPVRRVAAARALCSFGKPALPVLRAAVEDPSPEVRDMVAQALSLINTVSDDAGPAP